MKKVFRPAPITLRPRPTNRGCANHQAASGARSVRLYLQGMDSRSGRCEAAPAPARCRRRQKAAVAGKPVRIVRETRKTRGAMRFGRLAGAEGTCGNPRDLQELKGLAGTQRPCRRCEPGLKPPRLRITLFCTPQFDFLAKIRWQCGGKITKSGKIRAATLAGLVHAGENPIVAMGCGQRMQLFAL